LKMSEERREMISGEMQEDMQDEILEEISEEISEEINEEISKEISEEISEESHEENHHEEKRRTGGFISKEMREMMMPALRLFIICLAAAFCLAFVYGMTKDTIELRNQQAAEEQRIQVMSGADSFEKVEGWEGQDETGLVSEVYAAYSGDELLGYVFSAVSSGYGGDVPVTVGVGSDGTITGVKVGDNQETPGLGSKAADEKFTGQYEGKDISGEIKVVKGSVSADDEIQAVSGATISTNAVNSAVQASAELGAKLLQQNGGGKK
jgi:electron transport complex protein RnfG